jgi:hypothetical protein
MSTSLLARFLLPVAFSLFACMAATQPTFCAFEVKVSTPSGTPAVNTPLALVRAHSITLSESATDMNGVARICDTPLEYVDIVVGFDMCGSVAVRDLKARWPETQRVFVTYVKTFCTHFTFSEKTEILLRIEDEHGRPVAGAQFKGKTAADSGSDISDALGRLFLFTKRGERLQGLVGKEGRLSAPISVPGTDDLELKIKLRPR